MLSKHRVSRTLTSASFRTMSTIGIPRIVRRTLPRTPGRVLASEPLVGGVGGLLTGLGLLAIPGVGPVVAAGWLVATAAGAATGAVVGGAAGGLVGSLTGAGVPDRDAQFYAEGVRRGGTLVTARVDDARTSTAREILQRYKSVDPAVRGAAYRESGWTSFDENAPAYTADQVAAERARYVGQRHLASCFENLKLRFR